MKLFNKLTATSSFMIAATIVAAAASSAVAQMAGGGLVKVTMRYRLKLTICLASPFFLMIGGSAANAQTYPTNRLTIVVPFAPGGTNDLLARIIAPKLAEELGQPVIVENRAGAGSTIGTAYVTHSKPDGYTLLLGSSALSIAPNIYAKLSYDVGRDLAPIILIAKTKMVVMTALSVPVDSVQELIALAKSQPGKLNYGSAGVGSSNHLADALFNETFGVDIVHVPFSGASTTLLALSAGQVQMMVDVLPTALPLYKAGKIKILAVVSDKRVPELPAVPTLAETGLHGFDAAGWNGILVPAATPAPIVARLSAAMQKIMGSPELQQQFRKFAVEPESSTPEAFGQLIRSETTKWKRVIETNRIERQ